MCPGVEWKMELSLDPETSRPFEGNFLPLAALRLACGCSLECRG